MFSDMQASEAIQSCFERLPTIISDHGHDSAGTQHILLAIIRGNPGVFEGRCSHSELEEAILGLAPANHSSRKAGAGEYPYTAAAVEVLTQAFADARREGGHTMELRHLVLALVDEQAGLASAAFRRVGISRREDLQ